jgi:hypothetical protein
MPHSELTNLDDEELMLRVRDNADEAAFTELVDRFSPGLTHYLCRITGPSSAAWSIRR